MKRPTMPQQELMTNFLIKHPEVAALFVDMGLGKTRAVLDALAHLFADGQSRGALIVAPLRVARLTWPEEIREWYPWMIMADLRTPAGMKAWREGSALVYLINYEQLPKFCEAVKEDEDWPADTVVWDELSKCKSHTSVRIKKFKPLRKRFTHHWGLTGTPMSNGYLDLFAQIRLLDGGERLGRNFTHFRDRFFDTDYMGWNVKIRTGSKELIQELISDITLTLREEDYLDIPAVNIEDINIPLPPDLRKEYKSLEKEFVLKLKSGVIDAKNAAVLVGKLLQFTSGTVYDESRGVLTIHTHKLDALEDIVKDLKKNPLLVATSFKHERKAILDRFPQAELWQEDSLDRWNRGEIEMLVADPRSIGHGLNLQHGGHNLVWFSPIYSRELYDQTNKRLARTGQKKETFIRRLLCDDTIDWAVVEALRIKGDDLSGLKAALKSIQSMRK